jgi:hypothetical protein
VQLDRANIVIRERQFLELFDLALHLLRQRARALCGLFAVCVLPAALFNHVLLHWVIGLDVAAGGAESTWWLLLSVWLIAWELPLVTAPLTLYLGQALFHDRVNYRRIRREIAGSLPQLLFYQGFLRGLLMLTVVAAPITHIVRPYLNEVILLERNRMSPGRHQRPTTAGRTRSLHTGWGGDLLGRWIIAMSIGLVLSLALLFGLRTGVELVIGRLPFENFTEYVLLPLSFWLVFGLLMTIVRFLAYLDLRIRREGWEIELAMRDEAQRLVRHPA